jgi:putative membrane protein insertion efficiency factor
VNAVRRGLWAAGAPVRALLIGGILVYRVTLSGLLGGRCRFEPSCSAYAAEAITRHGAARGSVLAFWRLLRCNPFGRPGLDPVPGDLRYDAVLRSVDPKARDTA